MEVCESGDLADLAAELWRFSVCGMTKPRLVEVVSMALIEDFERRSGMKNKNLSAKALKELIQSNVELGLRELEVAFAKTISDKDDAFLDSDALREDLSAGVALKEVTLLPLQEAVDAGEEVFGFARRDGGEIHGHP